MKSLFKPLISVMLVLGFAFVGLACNGQTTVPTTGATEEVSIYGEYSIDITDLGMPLVFYLKIESDNTFQLAPDRQFDVDKGHGTVGQSGSTYMFIYSDSTLDEPKTSTFTVENNNLHFSTLLHYGASRLGPSKEDDDNPEIVYWLVAKTLHNESVFGEYMGGHTVGAMGSSVEYEYALSLKAGNEFAFISNYEMGGESYDYEESGFFAVQGSQIILKIADEDDVVGTINQDGSITIGVKPSEMGERSERLLQLAVTASCASTYTGYKKETSGSTVIYDTSATLILDKFGGYIFTAVDAESGTITETGSFTITGTQLTFYPSDSEEEISGTLVNYQLTAPFKLSVGAESRTSIKLYCQTIQGEFTATGQDAEENEYQATVTLLPNGRFTLVVLDQDETEIISDSGTFGIFGFMLNLIGSKTYSTVFSATGININIEIAPEVQVGFILKKAQ
ncbi:MAG: hypothetical protein WC351_01275 [Candidatus Izemoplasmatales bacterium]